MVPQDCRYTREHEWIRRDGDDVVIGITEYAQSALGDIVFIDLPKPGTALRQMQAFGSVEAVKAVSDLFSPVSGQVVAVNDAVATDPSVVNRDPHGEGWLLRARGASASEFDTLLSPADYEKLVAELEAEH